MDSNGREKVLFLSLSKGVSGGKDTKGKKANGVFVRVRVRVVSFKINLVVLHVKTTGSLKESERKKKKKKEEKGSRRVSYGPHLCECVSVVFVCYFLRVFGFVVRLPPTCAHVHCHCRLNLFSVLLCSFRVLNKIREGLTFNGGKVVKAFPAPFKGIPARMNANV